MIKLILKTFLVISPIITANSMAFAKSYLNEEAKELVLSGELTFMQTRQVSVAGSEGKVPEFWYTLKTEKGIYFCAYNFGKIKVGDSSGWYCEDLQ